MQQQLNLLPADNLQQEDLQQDDAQEDDAQEEAPTPAAHAEPEGQRGNPQQEPHPGHVLVPEELKPQLHRNWKDESGNRPPVLKIFNPAGAATWLIYSLNPQDDDTLFALADLGFQSPELGYVSLQELQEIRVTPRLNVDGFTVSGPTMPLERDLYFQPNGSLNEYSRAAHRNSRIVDNANA